MATTIRPQPQSNAANNSNNPQLKRRVYSKYRELLGSYNGRANEIIQTLPAFMVHEDKGFNIVIDSVPAPITASPPPKKNYGTHPPPPPPMSGNIGTRRLPSELPPEPPACVQNAMMTKDKKPFTYTPGGIDLSQIKSPRMAKRVSQNACSEGVTNKPRPSPLAQPNGTQLPPAPSMGAAAMGMPFQVFPTGPPAGAPPPPPPPKQQQQLTPTLQQTNGNAAAQRKSPLPQSYEPLPMGYRPEIKIPENPMATLKKTPKPQPKDDFWVEEYRKERSKSPMDVRTTEAEPEPQTKPYSPQVYSPKPASPELQQQSSPRMQANQTPPVFRQSPVPPNLPPPIMPTKVFQGQRSPPAPELPRAQSPSRPQNIAKNAQLGSLYIPPVSAENLASNAPKVVSPPWMSSGRVKEADEKPEWVHKDEPDYRKFQPQLSSGTRERVIPIQIEPATPTPTRTPATPSLGPQPFYNTTQPQYNQVQPPPVAFQSPPLPYYNNNTNPNQFVNQGYQNAFGQPQSQQQQFTQVKPFSPPPQLQGPVYTITQTGQPPRVVPMQVEGRGSSNNNGQFDNGNNGYARGPVSQSPAVFTSDPRTLQQQQSWGNNTPNQSRSFRVLQKITDTLVDQGDDENESRNEPLDDQPAQLQQPQYSRPLQYTDMNENQLRRLQLNEHDRALMNRVKNQVDDEQYLHSVEDPRYRGGAIPSKAFRYLQTMTDGGPNSNEAPINRNNARFVQQKSAYEQRDENTQYVPPSEQQVQEPKKYTGSSIPSRSFKILQQMTQPENAADNNTSDIEDNSNLANTNNTYPPPPYPYPYPPSPYPYPYYDPGWQQCYPDPTNGHPYQAYPPPPPQYPPDPRYFGYPYHPYFYGYAPPHGYIDPRRVDYTSESDNGNVSETESRASTTRTLTGYRSDSETRTISRNPPRIVVTPTPEDEAIYRVQNAQLADDTEARETLGLLSQKLSTFNKQEDQNNRNNHRNIKKYVGENGKIAAELLNNSEDEEDDHVVSIIDNTHPSLSPEKKITHLDEPVAQNFGLQTLRSVTDISKYDKSDSDSGTEDSDTDTEKEEPPIQNGRTEEPEENAEDASEAESGHLPHQLSIIFEENESIKSLGRRDSLISNGSTISDCSTTIANESEDSDTEELSKQVKVAEIAQTDTEVSENEDDDDDEEESVSISVRLPLRLSFSRSLSNHDETVATVTVGHSEIKDTDSSSSIGRRNSNPKSSSSSSLSSKALEPEKTSSFSTLQAKAVIKVEDTIAENDNEVCVTLSIPSTRANSVDRRGSSSLSVERSFSLVETNANNDMESDSEVSVSISLPLRRNKFSGACLNLGSSDNVKSPQVQAHQNGNGNDCDDDEISDEYTTDDDVEDDEIKEIEESNSPTTMARSSGIMKNESYEQMRQPCSLFKEEPPKTNGCNGVKTEIKQKSFSESEYETETDEEVEEEEKEKVVVNKEPHKQEPTKISRIKSKDSILTSLEGFKLQTIINSDFMNGFKPVSPIKSETKDTLPEETDTGSSSEYESDDETDDESEEKPDTSKKSPFDWQSSRSPDTQPRKSSTAETVIEKSWVRKNSSTDSTINDNREWARKKSCDTLTVNNEWTRRNSKAEVKDESPVEFERLRKSSIGDRLAESPIKSEWTRKSSVNETIAETMEMCETVETGWESEKSNTGETTNLNTANYETTKPFKFNLIKHSVTPPKLTMTPEPEEKVSSDEEETDNENCESEENEPIDIEKKHLSPAPGTAEKEQDPESEESEEESETDESDDEKAVVAHSSDARNELQMAPTMFKPIMRNPYSDDDLANTQNQLQSLVTAYRSGSVNRSERNSLAMPDNVDFTNEISSVALKKTNVDRKEPVKHKSNGILDAFKVTENEQEVKVSVRDKISVFEATSRQNSETPTRQFTRAESCTPSTQPRFKIHPSISDAQAPDHVILRAKSMTPTNHLRGSLDSKLNNRFTSAKKIVRRLERQNSLPPQKLVVREAPKLTYRHSFNDKIEESTSNDSLVQEPSTPRKTLGDQRKEWRLSSSHSSSHKSSFDCESEMDEDSGVNSDLSKHINEPETDSENFPELRKLSHYQRAATHSRLFKLLQGECEAEDLLEAEMALQTQTQIEEVVVKRPKKIVHNVSVARRQNPDIIKDAETMEARRQRLSLPLVHQNSSGIESMSSSPSSPVNEKLAAELVQSMLMKSKGKAFRNIPIEKLQAAALKILQEDLDTRSQDSLSSRESFTTVDSTPALTPLEFKNSYSEYYDTWNADGDLNDSPFDIIPSKAFKTLQDQAVFNGAQKVWSARCPRVLSSKTINKDLKRLSEVRESESPEPHVRSPSRSISRNSNNKSTTPMSGDPPSSYHRSSSYNHAS